MKRLSRNKSRHHLKPRSKGGTNDKSNLSIVTKKRHRAFHLLFGVMTPQQIANELNNKWLDPQFEFVVEKR